MTSLQIQGLDNNNSNNNMKGIIKSRCKHKHNKCNSYYNLTKTSLPSLSSSSTTSDLITATVILDLHIIQNSNDTSAAAAIRIMCKIDSTKDATSTSRGTMLF